MTFHAQVGGHISACGKPGGSICQYGAQHQSFINQFDDESGCTSQMPEIRAKQTHRARNSRSWPASAEAPGVRAKAGARASITCRRLAPHHSWTMNASVKVALWALLRRHKPRKRTTDAWSRVPMMATCTKEPVGHDTNDQR